MSDSETPTVTVEGGPHLEPTPDSAMPEWLSGLPESLRPYASLARWDRPVGIWLLVLPCWIGLAFTRIGMGWHWIDLWWAILFFIGAVAMRGAGCTWNDIADQDLDAGVERTAARPLPSGQVSTQEAYIWLSVQLFIGFLVWLCLPRDAKYVALLSIPLVAAYPFMKRYTWWPQAWLGMTFNWGGARCGGDRGSYQLFDHFSLVCLDCLDHRLRYDLCASRRRRRRIRRGKINRPLVWR